MLTKTPQVTWSQGAALEEEKEEAGEEMIE